MSKEERKKYIETLKQIRNYYGVSEQCASYLFHRALRSKKKSQDNLDEVMNSSEDFKYRIRTKMPLKITISREYAENKERLNIEEVVDREGNEVSKFYFELSPQTLTNPAGFWLDTGEFKLGRRS